VRSRANRLLYFGYLPLALTGRPATMGRVPPLAADESGHCRSIREGLDAVELADTDNAVEGRGTLTTGIREAG